MIFQRLFNVLEEVAEGRRRLDVLEVDRQALASLAGPVGRVRRDKGARRLHAEQQADRPIPAVGDGRDEAEET